MLLHNLLHKQHNIHIICHAGFAVDKAQQLNNQQKPYIDYYKEFKHNKLLQQELYTYKNHIVYGLEAQCIALNEALIQIQNNKKCNYILIAHSIGAYVLSQLQYRYSNNLQNTLYSIKQHNNIQQLNIIYNFLLFPFIRYDLNIMKHYMFKLSYYLRIFVFTTAYIIKLLPRSYQIYLLYYLVNDLKEPHALYTTLQLLSTIRMIAQIFYMAHSEFKYLPSQQYTELMPNVINSIQRNTTLYYASKHNDHWAPISQANDLKKQFNNLDIKYNNECTHAFCVRAHEYTGIAKDIAEYINNQTNNTQQQQNNNVLHNNSIGNENDVFRTINKYKQSQNSRL